jgi:NADH-quinone oxidoreductase subunit C
VPDATGLELLAAELRDRDEDIVLDTLYFRRRATLLVAPEHNRTALEHLREEGYTFLASVHGVDYYPEEPRLGVLYELMDMEKVDRITVKCRVHTEKPEIPSVVDMWIGADHQEREIYDMFGVVFDDHPDLRRILMPEDYEGFPQRRDFPIGGEPIIFTKDEGQVPRWTE